LAYRASLSLVYGGINKTAQIKCWEFFHLIEGKVVITNEEGESWTIRKGEAAIIPEGFKGTWDTVEPVRKHYVTLDAKL